MKISLKGISPTKLVLVLSLQLFLGTAFAHYTPDYRGNPVGIYNGGWGGWSRAVTEFGDYMRWLGQLRLNTAQARYADALAQQEYVRARAMARAIRSLEADLRALESQLWKLRSAGEQIERKGKILNRLLQGSVDGNVLMAMGFFTTLISADALETFNNEVPPISASDFTLVYGYREQCNPITETCERQEIEFNDFPGGNVWEFIEWLRPQAVKARPGSAGFLQLVQLRNTFLEAGTAWAAAIEKKRIEQENRKLDIWGPVYSGTGLGLPSRSIE